jgi:hypothetical protein
MSAKNNSRCMLATYSLPVSVMGPLSPWHGEPLSKYMMCCQICQPTQSGATKTKREAHAPHPAAFVLANATARRLHACVATAPTCAAFCGPSMMQASPSPHTHKHKATGTGVPTVPPSQQRAARRLILAVFVYMCVLYCNTPLVNTPARGPVRSGSMWWKWSSAITAFLRTASRGWVNRSMTWGSTTQFEGPAKKSKAV